MKKNEKGFVLIELLTATIVIMLLFIYSYTRLDSEITKIETDLSYNSVDSKYASFYLRKLFMNYEYDLSNDAYLTLYSKDLGCNYIKEERLAYCNLLNERLGVEEVIVTANNIKDLKKSYQGVLKSYIDYLPNYDNTSNKSEYLRLILKSKDGYATTNLYIDKDTINVGAVCKFNSVSKEVVTSSEEVIFTLNCNSNGPLLEDSLTSDNFLVLDDNNILDNEIIKEITLDKEGNSYTYNIKVIVDEEVETTVRLQLKKDILKDVNGNFNKESDISPILTIKGSDYNV